jgi:hypothetical protein
MSTAAQLILSKYHTLTTKIDDKLPGVFPEWGTVDAIDICTIISTFFTPYYGSDYRPVIRMLLNLKGITYKEQDIDDVYPDISDFVDFCVQTVRQLEDRDAN